MHDLPPSLFDGNNFNTSPPVVACAVSHALAWRSQRQGRGLLVLEDDVNMVLNVRDRIDKVRRSAREVGAELVMMAPGETFEEDTVTCSADGDDCSDGDDEGVRVLRQKMTLYTQVQLAHPALCWSMTSHTPRHVCTLSAPVSLHRRRISWMRVRDRSCCGCCTAGSRAPSTGGWG